MKKRHLLSLIFMLLLVSSCNNLNTHPKVARINRDMLTTYHNDSSLASIGSRNAGVCKFYPNGMIKSVFSMRNYTIATDIVQFDSSGKVKVIECLDSLPLATIFFKSYDKIEALPHTSVISKASTFITIDPNADTIILGGTYTAKILVNFPLKGYESLIYWAQGKKGDAFLFGKGAEAIFIRNPTDTGEHKYAISVRQAKYNNHNGKVDTTYSAEEINCLMRFYVKSK